jgi:hypothetical protein
VQKEWFLFNQDHHTGPFSAQEVVRSLALGQISESTYLWKNGLETWLPLKEIEDLVQADSLQQKSFNQEQYDYFLSDLPKSKNLYDYARGTVNQFVKFQPPKLAVKPKRQEVFAQIDAEKTILPESLVESESTPPPFDFKTPEINDFPDLPMASVHHQEHQAQNEDLNVDFEIPPLPPIPLIESPLDLRPELSVSVATVPETHALTFAVSTGNAQSVGSTASIGKKANGVIEQEFKFRDHEEEYERPDKYLAAPGLFWYIKKYFLRPFLLYGIPLILIAASIKLGFELFIDQGRGLPERTAVFSEADYQKLKNATQVNPLEQVALAYAVARNGKSIWMASNFSDDVLMSVKISSLKDQVLTDNKVVLSSEAEYRSGFVEFKTFNMLEGSERVPGFYQVQLSSVHPLPPRGFINRLKDKIYKLKYKGEVPLKKFNHSQIIFWGNSDVNEQHFKTLISKQKEYQKNKNYVHYEDLIQNYSTLIEMIGQVEYLLFPIINQMKVGTEISVFQKNYQMQVGRMLGDMVIGNDKILVELRDKERKLALHYEDLINDNKKFGEMVSDIVVNVKKIRAVNDTNRASYVQFYQQKINDFSAQLKSKRKAINEDFNRVKIQINN